MIQPVLIEVAAAYPAAVAAAALTRVMIQKLPLQAAPLPATGTTAIPHLAGGVHAVEIKATQPWTARTTAAEVVMAAAAVAAAGASLQLVAITAAVTAGLPPTTHTMDATSELDCSEISARLSRIIASNTDMGADEEQKGEAQEGMTVDYEQAAEVTADGEQTEMAAEGEQAEMKVDHMQAEMTAEGEQAEMTVDEEQAAMTAVNTQAEMTRQTYGKMKLRQR